MKVMRSYKAMKELQKKKDQINMYQHFRFFDAMKLKLCVESQITIAKHWRKLCQDKKRKNRNASML